MKLIAKNVKRKLEELGLTQTELAAKLGISKQCVNSYLANFRNPRKETAEKIAKELKCNLLDIATYDEEVLTPYTAVIAIKQKIIQGIIKSNLNADAMQEVLRIVDSASLD